MKILVTGHLGYVGTALTPILLAKGYEVTGCDSDLYEKCACRGIGSIALVPNPVGDFRDLTVEHLTGYDAVIHLAGITTDSLAESNQSIALGINHLASVRLAEIARLAGVSRFLMASTCGQYGSEGEEVIDLTGNLAPVTTYAKAKLLAEQDILALAEDGFTPAFLRIGSPFGVSPRMRLDTVLNDFAARAVTTGLISLKSDGTSWRPIVHVDDVARAFLAATEAPVTALSGQIFNIGNQAHYYRLRDLAQIVADTVPCCRLEFAPQDGPDERSHRVSFEATERGLPGFRTHWDARRGIEQLCEVYQALGLTQKDLEGSRFDRHRHIDTLKAEGILEDDLRRQDHAVLSAMTALAS